MVAERGLRDCPQALPKTFFYQSIEGLNLRSPTRAIPIPGVDPSRVLVKFLRAAPGFQLDTLPLWGLKGPGGSIFTAALSAVSNARYKSSACEQS